jgi:hypothetical protein
VVKAGAWRNVSQIPDERPCGGILKPVARSGKRLLRRREVQRMATNRRLGYHKWLPTIETDVCYPDVGQIFGTRD